MLEVRVMLKITVEKTETSTNFKVEGKLAGPWVVEFERSWEASASDRGQRVIVDISEVTFVDSEGQKLLARIHREGAKLQARGCMNRSIVDQIERWSGGSPPSHN